MSEYETFVATAKQAVEDEVIASGTVWTEAEREERLAEIKGQIQASMTPEERATLEIDGIKWAHPAGNDAVAFLEVRLHETLTVLARLKDATDQRAQESGGIGQLYTREALLKILAEGQRAVALGAPAEAVISSGLAALVEPTEQELAEVGTPGPGVVGASPS